MYKNKNGKESDENVSNDNGTDQSSDTNEKPNTEMPGDIDLTSTIERRHQDNKKNKTRIKFPGFQFMRGKLNRNAYKGK